MKFSLSLSFPPFKSYEIFSLSLSIPTFCYYSFQFIHLTTSQSGKGSSLKGRNWFPVYANQKYIQWRNKTNKNMYKTNYIKINIFHISRSISLLCFLCMVQYHEHCLKLRFSVLSHLLICNTVSNALNNHMNSFILTHCCRETLKGVHRQTVQTLIRCRIMRHLISVSTVC